MRVSAADTRLATATLRTATGREATRWVAAHFRDVPWLAVATVLTTVAGAALAVLPVLLLGRVVDGVIDGEPPSILVTIGALMVAAALVGVAATGASTYLIGRLGSEMLARLREDAVRAVLGMPSARIEQVGRGTCCPGSATMWPCCPRASARPSPRCSRRECWSSSPRPACSGSTGDSVWQVRARCPRTRWPCAGISPVRPALPETAGGPGRPRAGVDQRSERDRHSPGVPP